jgi:DNA-binding response OmpR family regulator
MNRPPKCVLIVDDDASTRDLLHDILEPEGYMLIEASDGQEAWELLAKQKVDLMITDRSMPGMGGLELLRKLKDEKKMLPTLMVSAYGEEKMWGDALGSGAQDYILKPFKAEEILKAVKKIISGERS